MEQYFRTIRATEKKDLIDCQPSVAIITLNWKGIEDTRACCESLNSITYTNATIFVVDNDSGDGSAEILSAEYPQFIHIANKENLGFSGGNNAVLQRALDEGFQYTLLLNNDTLVGPDFLDKMVSAAEADPKIGMVGSKIYYHSDPEIIWYAGGTVNFDDPEPFRHVGIGIRDEGQFDVSSETDWITGCCLLVRNKVIAEVGMLDENYGFYCEDVDWSLRLKNKGWKIWYESKSQVWHKIGQAMDRENLPARMYHLRNTLLVARKNLTFIGLIKFYHLVSGQVLRHPSRGREKAGLVEFTIRGILGRGGPIKESGKIWWSRGLATMLTTLKDFKNNKRN